jgi:hypothetical protein
LEPHNKLQPNSIKQIELKRYIWLTEKTLKQKQKMIRHLLAFAFVAITIQISAQAECVYGDCENGIGKLVTSDFSYEGSFKDQKFQGKGKLKLNSGDLFDGLFSAGVFKEGEIKMSDGSSQNGKFIDFKLEGDGLQIYADGSKIEGSFVGGNIVKGTITYSDGTVLSGTFTEDKLLQGQGSKKQSDGTTFKGEFVKGYIVQGRVTFPIKDDRDYYEGSFALKDGINSYNGKGRLYLKNGNYRGDKWFNGKQVEGDKVATIPAGKFAVNLSKKGGVYEVVGIITNGQHVLSKDFILDTGASLVVLPWSTVVELMNQNIISSTDFFEGSIALTTASGDKMEGKKFKIKQINFEFKSPDGKPQIISLKDVEAVVNTSESERRRSIYGLSNAPTLLGQSALQQFKKFELDFEQNLLLINNP